MPKPDKDSKRGQNNRKKPLMNLHTNTLNKVKYICFLKREYRGLTAKDMREFYGDRKDLNVDGINGSICLFKFIDYIPLTIYLNRWIWFYVNYASVAFLREILWNFTLMIIFL